MPLWLCQTDLYTAEPPAPVLDTATGFLDPGPPRLEIGPGLSQNPGHPRSRSLAGMDSKQSSLSGSILLQKVQGVQQAKLRIIKKHLKEHNNLFTKVKASTFNGAIINVLKHKTPVLPFLLN